MTRDDVMRFGRDNQRMINFMHISAGDYSAARCCYLNGLMQQGAILGEQAVEKGLKAFLLCLNRDEKVAKFRNHQLVLIIDRIQEIQDAGLDQYRLLAQRLSDLYDYCRYPDPKVRFDRLSMSSEDVHELDAVYFYIVQNLPIPLEVKYRTGIYAFIGEGNNSSHIHPTAYWLTQNNKVFLGLRGEIEQNYQRVLTHLYPTR